jgi:uncharacterized protein (DUF934 family)
MAKLIKDKQIIDDVWTVVARTETALPAGNALLLPVTLWLQHQDTLATRQDIGLWFDSDESPDAVPAEALRQIPLIGVNFPVFTDGRGFSIGRLLRERYNFTGELRAFGYVLQDQLCFLKRCGFDSFELQAHVDPAVALASLDDFTEYYQTSVDQPQPLFRRS